jgi:1-aminocyclopropane-1-carboxylate deaminase/D-cysteine desulfhydrase-like pyridoxal-dependent ACC family enzyme
MSSALPRIPLARLPTPYEPAPRLAAAAGLRVLWIKREDHSGPALGGNKIRQIEVILGAARAAGADTVVTTAASQSNFCRALAGCAAQAGLGCRLLLRASGGTEPVGNLLLMRLFGAEISFTDATDPWHPSVRAELDAISDDLRARGRVPLIVQLPGETAALAAAAWALAVEELAADFSRAGDAPELFAVACGSSLTLAGLAVGFAHHGLPTRLLGVSVQQPAARLVPWVTDICTRTAALLGWEVKDAMARVRITDDQIPPGYAKPSEAGLAALMLAARTEGLVLDPSYTGKAMAGLLAAARPGGTAAFLHSGGAPALFAHGAEVAAALTRR